MVSASVKVSNSDFVWIRTTVVLCLNQNQYRAECTVNNRNRLEFKTYKVGLNVESKIVITSNPRKAGSIGITVGPLKGTRDSYVNQSNIILDLIANTLRYSIDDNAAMQKCWNCFEPRDFRHNFCEQCGKS